MTGRDRLVIIGLGALAVLGAVWLLLVAPERKQAAKLNTEVTAATAQLATAETQATTAHAARARYSAAYSSIVNLGKAVPADQEVPSLMYQLAQASNEKHVEFNSILSGAGVSSGSGGASTSPTASPSTTAAASGSGFTQMPFTFVFNGSFPDLYHMFNQMNGFTVRTTSGGLRVSGRLLTIQGVKLAPLTSAAEQSAGAANARLTGTITATAYVLPAGQALTGGASAASPAGTSAPAASSQPSPSTGTSNTPSAPAAVSVAR